jgi:hypothetical protein
MASQAQICGAIPSKTVEAQVAIKSSKALLRPWKFAARGTIVA